MAGAGQQRDTESGMASAELAIGLVSLLLVLSLVLGAVRVGMDRAVAVGVAGAMVREAARGADPATVWAHRSHDLPPGASFTLSQREGTMTVTVHVPARGGLVGLIVGEGAQISAVARAEQ
ncbi:MAG: hypothetical protein Q4G67_09240 [Actinomycetia bacterium]|nr:hypothetical protein [Actinomycetes bacterium]